MTEQPVQPSLRREDKGDSVGGLLRHSSIYAIAPIVQRLLALALVPLYTRVLGDAKWGVLSLTDLLLGFLPILAGTSILAGMSRFYFVRQGEQDRDAVVTTSLLGVAVSSILISAIGWFFRDTIAIELFSKETSGSMQLYENLVTLCLAIFPLSLISSTGIQALQLKKRSKAVVKILLAKAVFEAGLKLWFLFGLDLGVEGFLYAILCGELLAAVPLGIWTLKSFGRRLSGAIAAPLLRYCAPLLPVTLFQLGLHQSDKLLINRLGPQDVVKVDGDVEFTASMVMLGIYALGYMIPFSLHVALNGSFQKIWQPNAFAELDEKERAARSKSIGSLAVLVLAGFQGAAALFAGEGVRVLTQKSELYGATAIVPWVAASYLGYAAYSLSQTALMSQRRTRTLAVVNGLALALNVALNFALIPRFGIQGAAAATLISFWCLALSAGRSSTSSGIPPFDVWRLSTAFCLVAACGISGALIDSQFAYFTVLSLALKMAFGLAVMAGIGAALPKEQRELFQSQIRERLYRASRRSAN